MPFFAFVSPSLLTRIINRFLMMFFFIVLCPDKVMVQTQWKFDSWSWLRIFMDVIGNVVAFGQALSACSWTLDLSNSDQKRPSDTLLFLKPRKTQFWFLSDNCSPPKQMGSIGSAQEVLRRAVYMCGVQIARDPQLRSVLRDALRERATITVKPTPRGLKEIDENHNCYG